MPSDRGKLGLVAEEEIEWVLLRTFADSVQASLLGEFLQNQGIQASVEGAFADGVLPNASGGVRVMVPTDRLDEAIEASEAFDGEHAPTAS